MGKVNLGPYGTVGSDPADGGEEAAPAGDSGLADKDAIAPQQGDSGVESACMIAAGPRHTFTSIQDVEAAITGRWQLCGGQINSPADTVGIEFAGDAAYFLVRDGNGSVVRGAGFAYERTVTITDTTQMNGAGWYQISLMGGGRGNHYFADYSPSPRKLKLNEGTSGNEAEYVADAPATTACSLVGGTWDVTENYWGTDASFQFFADGSFVGGPRSASLPGAATMAGSYSDGNGMFHIGPTRGMQCDEWQTNSTLTFDAACTTATLQVQTDNCTGGRKYFGGRTTLLRH